MYIRIYGWLPTQRVRLGCLVGAKCEFFFCILLCPVSGLASYRCHVLLSVTFCSSLLHTSWGKNTFRMPLSSASFCTPGEALSSSDVTYTYVLLFTSPRKGNRGATDWLCLFYQGGTKYQAIGDVLACDRPAGSCRALTWGGFAQKSSGAR